MVLKLVQTMCCLPLATYHLLLATPAPTTHYPTTTRTTTRVVYYDCYYYDYLVLATYYLPLTTYCSLPLALESLFVNIAVCATTIVTMIAPYGNSYCYLYQCYYKLLLLLPLRLLLVLATTTNASATSASTTTTINTYYCFLLPT